MHQTQWSAERSLPPPVSLTSQSHHEKPPEVTCTSRGTPGCPASTRERPRETFFNTSRGQIPLLWLESKDALPLAIRLETRLPCRPTRGSLTSPYTKTWIDMQARLGAPWLGWLDNPRAFLTGYGWRATLTQPGATDANYGRWTMPVVPLLAPELPHNWYVKATRVKPRAS